MKAFASALACLIPLSASAAEEDAMMQKAFRIITQHCLLSRAELTCSSLVLDGNRLLCVSGPKLVSHTGSTVIWRGSFVHLIIS